MSLNITAEASQFNAKTKVNSIIDRNMEYLINTIVIPEIKLIVNAANMPPKFADGIKFKRTGPNEGEIINTWGTYQKPLALWFNNGTKDHGPVVAPMLHWKDKVTGKDIYAKFVRGIRRTLAMNIGIEIGMDKLKTAVPELVEKELE